MIKKLYTVTSIHIKDTISKSYSNDLRTPGIFTSFEDAEKAVLENNLDWIEHFYNYAVIEEIDIGMYPTSLNQYWYYVKGNPESDYVISSCDPPECYKNDRNFGIG